MDRQVGKPGRGHRAARGSPDVVGGWRLVGVGQVLVEPDGDSGSASTLIEPQQVPDGAVHLVTDQVVGQQPGVPGRSSRSTTRVRVRVSAGS